MAAASIPDNAFLKYAYPALFALLPWSVECVFPGWNIDLPAEPLVLAIGIVLLFQVIRQPAALRAVFCENGRWLFITSALWVVWMGFCAFFSTMPAVSWKFWVVEAGHWWVFAVGFSLFPQYRAGAFGLFAGSMAGVVVYTLMHHATFHFRADQALLAPMPFFPENTLYGAVCGMAAVLWYPFSGDIFHHIPLMRRQPERWRHVVFVLLLVGVFFSFSRAAVLSLVAAGGVIFAFSGQNRFRFVVAGGLLLLLSLLLWREAFVGRLGRDVSSLERLNRYASALRMSLDRPLMGFGPGTFQFQYIPYQKPEQMTRISATAPVTRRGPDTYGRGGGAHSEWMQALAETGWPGMLWWLVLVFVGLASGARQLLRARRGAFQPAAAGVFLCLCVFLTHSFVNNTLHEGCVAALFWGCISYLIIQGKTHSKGPAG